MIAHDLNPFPIFVKENDENILKGHPLENAMTLDGLHRTFIRFGNCSVD
jgi:hypothetical protein